MFLGSGPQWTGYAFIKFKGFGTWHTLNLVRIMADLEVAPECAHLKVPFDQMFSQFSSNRFSVSQYQLLLEPAFALLKEMLVDGILKKTMSNKQKQDDKKKKQAEE
jgi:hypothetical protein